MPISADQRTFLEIQGYRDALGYVLAMGEEDFLAFDTTELRAMHYLMLRHDSSKSPGRYRKGPVFVHDERSDHIVYEGPNADDVPSLMDALVDSLRGGADLDPIVRSAMAHLCADLSRQSRSGDFGKPKPQPADAAQPQRVSTRWDAGANSSTMPSTP